MQRVVEMPDATGVAHGDDHPEYWIDKFHPHGVRQRTAFRAAPINRSTPSTKRD